MLKVYLDNCVFNRPFDDQNQIRIRLETEAKFYIQTQIKQRRVILVWSYVLELENAFNPFAERQRAIAQWQAIAQIDISESSDVLRMAHSVQASGLRGKDALHIACALEAAADYFITTDDSIIKKMHSFAKLRVVTPLEFVDYVEEIR